MFFFASSVQHMLCKYFQQNHESVYVSLGASLEQVHIFALAHILRRPIIVYGIKYVKSYHGDNIGLARFQG